jgi:hypothetical protein
VDQLGLKALKLYRKNYLKLGIIVPLLLISLILASCSSASASSINQTPGINQTDSEIRTNTGGSVTLEVKNLGKSDNSFSFSVVMDTHSINLDRYDLKQLAELKDDQGNEYQPISWDSAAGGHHRTGTLKFLQIGSQVEPHTLELVIRDIAGVKERIFKWESSVS